MGEFVQDPTQAFIPGVSVTATNTQTGVATTVITMNRERTTFPVFYRERIKLTAELAGFKMQIINEVQLGQGVTADFFS